MKQNVVWNKIKWMRFNASSKTFPFENQIPSCSGNWQNCDTRRGLLTTSKVWPVVSQQRVIVQKWNVYLRAVLERAFVNALCWVSSWCQWMWRESSQTSAALVSRRSTLCDHAGRRSPPHWAHPLPGAARIKIFYISSDSSILLRSFLIQIYILSIYV